MNTIDGRKRKVMNDITLKEPRIKSELRKMADRAGIDPSLTLTPEAAFAGMLDAWSRAVKAAAARSKGEL